MPTCDNIQGNNIYKIVKTNTSEGHRWNTNYRDNFSVVKTWYSNIMSYFKGIEKSKEKITTNWIARREISSRGAKNRGHCFLTATFEIHMIFIDKLTFLFRWVRASDTKTSPAQYFVLLCVILNSRVLKYVEDDRLRPKHSFQGSARLPETFT